MLTSHYTFRIRQFYSPVSNLCLDCTSFAAEFLKSTFHVRDIRRRSTRSQNFQRSPAKVFDTATSSLHFLAALLKQQQNNSKYVNLYGETAQNKIMCLLQDFLNKRSWRSSIRSYQQVGRPYTPYRRSHCKDV